MKVLGIDPGTATTGWGIVESEKSDWMVNDFGLIETSKDKLLLHRLDDIYKEMKSLIKRVNPDVMAIEKIFFATNAKTAISVGQALGVMLLTASQLKVPVFEYAPGTIKKVISGDGRADKKYMQKALREMFGPKIKSKAHQKTHFDNSADALAVAMCHIISVRKLP